MNDRDQQNDKPRESCGIFGIFGVPGASRHIYNGLFALQHRGQEGAGIVVSDGEKIRSIKGMGLLSEVFAIQSPEELPGNLGIGHVRYSTTGSSLAQNVQPIVFECMDGIWALAHNGNLTNARRMRRSYQEAGAIFQTSTDSEILMHLIADPMYRSRNRRVERALSELEGAFSFVLMTKDSVMATRDRYGFRPLSIGKLGDGYVFASETCALDQVGATYIRDVLPGELVIADAKGIRSSTFCEPVTGSLGQCIFEHVYFARPDSMVFGQSVHETRLRLGRQLAKEQPVEADLVIPVPDSGSAAALGYSQFSGIPMDYGFIRNHYVGRTFIMPEKTQRSDSVDMKLAVVPGVVRDKRIVVVDDSIIRGTTCRRRIESLRKAGAKEIHMRISCPPTRNPCYFGIDFPSRTELIAAGKEVQEIQEFIGADSLAYLSLEGMLSAFDHPGDYCTGCFNGKYAVDITEDHSKKAMETGGHLEV
ncbi:MAG TPA: amidophosphoribosyltransferase [Verrucomicrobia bacterium]|nr:MAG: amidophosphoribosyltransferase [Lentisphaerae bacterium GWF2_57_35]HBA83060.1 amidophosphoribosyltransferase [Verrucomicrobiota bacterium]